MAIQGVKGLKGHASFLAHALEHVCLLRLYPPRFVGAIFELQESFVREKPIVGEALLLEGFKKPWQAPSTKTIRQLLVAMPLADTWDDAELYSVYRYVRGSKQLRVPESLKSTLVG